MISNALFLGSKKFGLEIFKSLYKANEAVKWTILCPQDLNDIRTHFDEFQEFSKRENLDLLIASSPEMVLEYAKDHKPDVMVVCGYYRILSSELFDYVGNGVWGIHNSLLPKYRGGSPLVWQMINNDGELGSSFFKFDKGVDDGPVLYQVKVKNSDDMTIKEAMNLIEEKWIENLPKIWKRFCDGDIAAVEQNHLNATYCAQRNENDGVIDWQITATELDAFIRAQAVPYPRTYFQIGDKRVRIVEHQKDNRSVYGRPGQVFEVRGKYVTVCCGGNSVIRLLKLEVEGKEVRASEVITSFKQRL